MFKFLALKINVCGITKNINFYCKNTAFDDKSGQNITKQSNRFKIGFKSLRLLLVYLCNCMCCAPSF